MSTRRWAGAGFVLLLGCFGAAAGCSSDDPSPSNPDGSTVPDAAVCSTAVTVTGCNTVKQNNVEFTMTCNSKVSTTQSGRAVCVNSTACNAQNCLDQATVTSCLATCNPNKDAGSTSDLGAACTAAADCGSGLTCLKSSDNLVPGAGPPNGICTADCAVGSNSNLCKTLGGTCVSFTTNGKAYCLEGCQQGKQGEPDSKCHARADWACAPLEPAGSACVPVCTSNADCGSRKCDFATGLCSDVLTPGAPNGSPCSTHADCSGGICYPFVFSDAGSSPGVCTSSCRLGAIDGCGYRLTPLDAGPAVGACLLGTPDDEFGDLAICAQLCDSTADCGTQDPRWTCVLDPAVQSGYKHAGYCWFNKNDGGGGGTPEAGRPDVGPEAGAPETGAPESGAPETGVPEASVDVTPEAAAPEAGTEAGADQTTDSVSDDAAADTVPGDAVVE